MTEYRDRITGQIKSQGQLRKENPNMSMPKVWNANVHEALNVDPILKTFAPIEGVGELQVAVPTDETEQDAFGNWKRKWIIVDRFTDLLDEEGNVISTKAEQEAEHLERRDHGAAVANRNTRDNLIAETDWWASSDLTMTAEQTAYRQALRDITAHANWPHLEEADWPVKP